MDLNMPGLDGVDTVKGIAGMDWSTRLEPMVVMVHDAGAKDAERVIEALSVGASGIVRKPSGTDHEANLAHLSDE
jgi:DNA-binding NarL/FixJ family response regulator